MVKLGTNNRNLQCAKDRDYNEFYTQYKDVEGEMEAYVDYNPDVFRDKIILLPCDDYSRSNFTKYFSANFNRLGIKKLISTCYGGLNGERGKIQIIENVNNKVIVSSGLLNGDGDFRGGEVTALRNISDFVITNPPFSLIRDLLAWLYEKRKNFSIIGGFALPTYKSVTPLFANGYCNIGASTPKHGKIWYIAPPEYYSSEIRWRNGVRYVGVYSLWCTNIPYKNNRKIELHTMEWNLKNNKQLRDYVYRLTHKLEYIHFVNYDAIEVPFMNAIPSDYPGVMGVPVTFFTYYNSADYDFIGVSNGAGLHIDDVFYGRVMDKNEINRYSFSCYIPCLTSKGIVNKEIFKRMFIRHKHPQDSSE